MFKRFPFHPGNYFFTRLYDFCKPLTTSLCNCVKHDPTRQNSKTRHCQNKLNIFPFQANRPINTTIAANTDTPNPTYAWVLPNIEKPIIPCSIGKLFGNPVVFFNEAWIMLFYNFKQQIRSICRPDITTLAARRSFPMGKRCSRSGTPRGQCFHSPGNQLLISMDRPSLENSIKNA